MNVKTFKYNGMSDSIKYSFRFEQGLPESNSPHAERISDRKRGTSIHWQFDASLFYDHFCDIPLSYFQEKLEGLSLRYPQKRFLLCIEPTDHFEYPDDIECYEYKNE
jgi:DNA gyrase/topoisomerase IV subunit B